jgi:hypothetical protein
MRNSKRMSIVAGGTAVLMGTGIAFAYWTTTGDGHGTASTGTSSSWAVTTDAATGDPLTPGGPTQTVAFHIENNNSGVQHLQGVVVSIKNANDTAWNVGSCTASDFQLGTPSFTAGDVLPGATANGSVTISMVNGSGNQNDCKNVTVPLFVHAS